MTEIASEKFNEFFDIVKRLRDPKDGCPWDLKQTANSLRSSLLEECYEAIDAITNGDERNLREELGDLFLLVTMIAYIKQQESVFEVADVLEDISAKLVRRHPHIFGGKTHFGASTTSSPDKIIAQWEEIKVTVEGKPRKDSALDEIPRTIPPLERSYRIQKKAAKMGFDWTEARPIHRKVLEELEECMAAAEDHRNGDLELEVGDLLFSVVNLARFLKIDPAVALHRTNEKFARRFSYVEQEMKRRDSPMDAEHLSEMDAIWNDAKAEEKK